MDLTTVLSQHYLLMVPLEQSGLAPSPILQGFIMAITHGVGAMLCFDLARRKNRPPLFWGWIGLLIGPLAALILIFLPHGRVRDV